MLEGNQRAAGRHALDHLCLAAAGELGREEAGEVALQEAEHQHVPHGGDGRDEDDGEGHKHDEVLRRLTDAAHLTWLQRAPCHITSHQSEF